MANCASLLAVVLPFLVAVAHIIGTGQLPISSSSLRRLLSTASSPRHQSSSSSGEVFHRRGDAPSFFDDGHQPPEPAILEDLLKRGSQAMDMAERLEHLANVLRAFGYNTMASTVTLLVDSTMLSIWSAPFTVFAVPDAALEEASFLDQQGPHPQLHFIEKKPSSYKKAKTTGPLEEACPSCPLRLLVLKQLALGTYSFSELSTRPSITITTPAINFCMSSKSTSVVSSGGGLTNVVSINSVDITRPELYKDGQLIIHGVKRYIELPPQGSCNRDGRALTLKEVMKILHDTFVGPVF